MPSVLPSPAKMGCVLTVIVGCCAHASSDELVLSTGPQGRTYDKIGQALKKALADADCSLELRLESSTGARRNIQRVLQGEADFGLTQCDILDAAFEGQGSFALPHDNLRMISLLHEEAIQVVARGDSPLASVADLRGKRVALDSDRNGWTIFAAHGFSRNDLQVVPLEIDGMLDALLHGDVDAFVVVGGVPHPPVREALEANCSLLSVAGAEHDKRLASHVRRYVDLRTFLHRSRLDLAVYGSSGTLETISVDGALICTEALDDEVGHELAQVLATSRSAVANSHPALRAYDFRKTSRLSPLPMNPGALRAMIANGAADYPIRVYTGVYLYSISELDLAEGSFLLDGYIWFRWMGPLLDDENFEFQVTNGQIQTIDDAPIRRENGWNRQSRRFTVKARKDFVLYDYPFDTQVLPLNVEHRFLGKEKLVFVPDEVAVGKDLGISDWVVREVVHGVAPSRYDSSFGVIARDWSGTSSRYVAKIALHRRITPYVVKTVLPLAIVVSVSFLVFFIHATEFNVQAGIAVSALLSCVALHISQANALPEVGYLVTADKFFLLAYVAIFLTLTETIVANHLHNAGRSRAAARLDRISCIALPTLFVAFVAYFVFSATA